VSTKSDDTMNENTPFGVASAVKEGVTPSVVDMTVEIENISSLEEVLMYQETQAAEPQTASPPITEPQNAAPPLEAHIEPILQSLTIYQRKRTTQKHRRTQKDTELPHTSVPLNLRADEAVPQEEGDKVERAITTDASLEATHASDNILKTQTTAMHNVDIP
nr:hypothetical protein [Tanacetum cinerariifolium]